MKRNEKTRWKNFRFYKKKHSYIIQKYLHTIFFLIVILFFGNKNFMLDIIPSSSVGKCGRYQIYSKRMTITIMLSLTVTTNDAFQQIQL